MKNIIALFRHDLRLATRNTIAVIVLFGVVVIPSFFAWFNVLASWDPFGNVTNLKVAVANGDKGYMSSLFPLRINIGEQVVGQLRANSDLDWVFTTPEGAVEGTKAGDYYAALVLPEDFSQNMMTFLAPGAKPATIDYYSNEKENALSPKITSQAATEVSTQINQSFTTTLNEVGLALISSLAHQLESPESQAILGRFETTVTQLAAQLHSGSESAQMFSALIAASKPLVESAVSLTDSSVAALQSSSEVIGEGASAIREVRQTLTSATEALAVAFAGSIKSFENLADDVEVLNTALGEQSKDAKAILKTIKRDIEKQISSYTTLQEGLAEQAQAATDAGNKALGKALQRLAKQVGTVIKRQEALVTTIDEAMSRIDQGTANNQDIKKDVQALINQAKAAIQEAQQSYTGNLKPKLDSLAGTLATIGGKFKAIGDDIVDAASSLSGGSGSLLSSLTVAEELTADMSTALESVSTKFEELATTIQAAADSGDLSEITTLIGANPAVLAGELAAPVALKTIPVFKVDSFGAQMTPFYSVLGMWVGAILLSVLIRADIDKRLLPPLKRKLTLTQEYLGRYGVFALLGLFQSTLLYVGLIGFVGVRPVYPLLLILAGWVMSTVFSLMTYTLVLSLGEAGKAVAVALLVLQISGGGGAYPLSVLPEWFQHASPFLPVTHATSAVRAAIAGIYEGDYWMHLGALLLFIIPTLLLGILLRLPLIKVNKDLSEALESTKLM